MKTKDKNLKKDLDVLEGKIQNYLNNKTKIKMKKKTFKEEYKEALKNVRLHLNNNTEGVGALSMSTA